MDIKQELENRVKSLEELIERKGIGSKQLDKARRTQRYLNITVIGISLAAVVGIAAWLSSGEDD
ncbi:hypothetical protein [Marinoscillum sp.]|uniref:hypothetical protein n=1 Tax=Marinoscillum sp. TaxID=2024838 RepID=UPI003BA8838E